MAGIAHARDRPLAGRARLELGDAGVRDRESQPGIGRSAERVADERPDDERVRDGDDHLIATHLGELTPRDGDAVTIDVSLFDGRLVEEVPAMGRIFAQSARATDGESGPREGWSAAPDCQANRPVFRQSGEPGDEVRTE